MSRLAEFRRLTGNPRRARSVRPPLPLREKIILFGVVFEWLWLTLYYGGVTLVNHQTAGGIALFVFLLLFIPLPDGPDAGERNEASRNLRTLLRFPGFWLGFGLLAYIWIQTWNNSYIYTHDGHYIRLIPNKPISWLPSGIITPLEETNPFRGMLQIFIPWLTGCTLWAGIHSRRMSNLILHVFGILFTAWAVLALYQLFFDAPKILGLWPTNALKENSEIPFFGTFINENHSAMFLILGNGLALGLFLNGFSKAMQRLRIGGVYLLYLGCSILISFSVLLTQARGGILLIALQWTLFLIFCSIFFIRHFRLKGAVFPGIFLLIGIGFALTFVSNPGIWNRMKLDWERSVDTTANPTIEGRYYMYNLCRDLIVDRPWLGWGSGSFRYVHKKYLINYPEYYERMVRWVPVENPQPGERRSRKVLLWFDQAHMDILQWFVEWGIVGMLFPFIFSLWLLYEIIRSRTFWDFGLLTILSAVLWVFLGGFWEFHFHIPAVFLSFWIILIATFRGPYLRRTRMRH